MTYEVAIVGGGIAGLYTTWRLTIDTKTFGLGDVVLYEASDRWGGRLFTRPAFEFDASLSKDLAVRAELGGMRISSTHTYVGSLANHLDLPFASFEADVPENHHFLRNGLLTGATLDSQTTAGPLYRLAANESGKTPSTIFENALTGGANPLVNPKELPSPTGNTLRQFVNYCLSLSVPLIDGRAPIPAYNLGFWNIVVDSGAVSAQYTVSNEAYSYYREAYAYDTIPANWNGAVGLSVVLSDFGNPPPTYYALATGYQTLPLALEAALAASNPQILQANTSVTSIAYDGSVFTLHGADGGVLSTAKRLVLALPPRALQIIFENSNSVLHGVDAQNFLDQIGQSSPIPLFKIFLVYTENDWWSGPLGTGWPSFTRMTTDLPMRQIYNFGFAPPAGGQACQLFQASYSDALYAGYWAGLMPSADRVAGNPDIDTDPFARIVPAAGGETIAQGMVSFDTSGNYADYPVFKMVHDQFVNLVTTIGAQQTPPVTVTPTTPVAGAAMNWATDPFGGGVNFWNVGVNVAEAYPAMLQPHTDVPMYIVGEGYSLAQGWVEGALWTVEDMFGQTGLCPTPPSWLDPKAQTFTPKLVVQDPAARGLPSA